MEPISLNCVRHKRLNELYCTVCKTYLCGECVTGHGKEPHHPKYLHVMQYSLQMLPKIDRLIEATKSQAVEAEADAAFLTKELGTLIPRMKEITEMHGKTAESINKLALQLGTYGKHMGKGKLTENVVAGLNNDKTRLKRAMETRKIEEVLRITQRIGEEAQLEEKKLTSAALIQQLEKAIEEMEKGDPLKPLAAAASAISAKCRLLRMVQYSSDWKCDRQYFSAKMSLSEDGLTFGNTAGSGYPAIIGDTLFDGGLYAFEVTPQGLDCTGKEGFGIIERDKYLAAFRSDSSAPTVHDDMIGFLYKNEAKNMTAEQSADMQMGSKYYVRVNMVGLSMTITGPGVKFKADLKPGMVYVPCFSCGCTGNKLVIRPLSTFDEGSSTD